VSITFVKMDHELTRIQGTARRARIVKDGNDEDEDEAGAEEQRGDREEQADGDKGDDGDDGDEEEVEEDDDEETSCESNDMPGVILLTFECSF
jgi:hypothetical protein